MALSIEPIWSAIGIYADIFKSDLLRYIVGAGGVFLVVNALGRCLLRGRRIRNRFIDRQQLQREWLSSLRTVAIFALFGGGIIYLGHTHGFLQTYADPAKFGWTWFWISTALLIVLHDAWFYWTHRLIHHPRLFRRFHRLHHKSNNPTPFTSYAFDTGEAIANAIYLPIAVAIFPASFFAMFLFTTHMMLRNAMGHCGYELFLRSRNGKPLFDWMTTVTHHDLHHAQAGYNYGLYFTFWDRVMKTVHPDYKEAFAASVRYEAPEKPQSQGNVLATIVVSLVCLAGMGVAVAPLAQAEAARISDVEGEWATQGYGAVVEIAPCQDAPDALCGELIWAWDEGDIPAEAIGTEMLSGFTWTGGAWRGGRLRHPVNGRSYRGTITPVGADRLELEGCAMVFCQSETWRRLESLPHVSRNTGA